MTLYEYLNQEDPERLKPGTVILQEDEFFICGSNGENTAVRVVGLWFDYPYAIKTGESVLRSRTEDWGIGEPTVFQLYTNIEQTERYLKRFGQDYAK